MKQINLLILAFLLYGVGYAQETKKDAKKLYLEINYFHRTERCKTCLSIQDNIQKVLDEDFADEVKSGKLSFHLINFQDMSDSVRVNKYHVEDPTLVITRFKKGKEKTIDLTGFAFDNSLHNGKVFREGFRDELNEMFR